MYNCSKWLINVWNFRIVNSSPNLWPHAIDGLVYSKDCIALLMYGHLRGKYKVLCLSWGWGTFYNAYNVDLHSTKFNIQNNLSCSYTLFSFQINFSHIIIGRSRNRIIIRMMSLGFVSMVPHIQY